MKGNKNKIDNDDSRKPSFLGKIDNALVSIYNFMVLGCCRLIVLESDLYSQLNYHQLIEKFQSHGLRVCDKSHLCEFKFIEA